MKREVERERKIPAFAIGVGELEALWTRLVGLYENPEEVYGSIDVVLPKERLEFESVEDLKQYHDLKGQITNFSIRISNRSRSISIRTHSILYSPPIVRASGESEAWCAGAIETVYTFLSSNKVWYHWLVSAPIGWIFIVLVNLPFILIKILPSSTINEAVYTGWLATIISLGFLYVFRGKLFPATALRITYDEGFIRRHSAELSLIIALLSVILTVVGLILK